MTGWTSELRGAMDTLSSYRIEIVSETWQTEKNRFSVWFSVFLTETETENRIFQFLKPKTKPKTKPKKLKKTGFFGFKNRFLNLNNAFKIGP